MLHQACLSLWGNVFDVPQVLVSKFFTLSFLKVENLKSFIHWADFPLMNISPGNCVKYHLIKAHTHIQEIIHYLMPQNQTPVSSISLLVPLIGKKESVAFKFTVCKFTATLNAFILTCTCISLITVVHIYMNRNCISMCLLLALGEIYRQYSTPQTPEAF